MARKPAKRKPTTQESYCVIGIDLSLTNISGACQAYDAVLGVYGAVAVHRVRWRSSDQWYSRMRQAAKAHDFILDLVAQSSLAGVRTENYVIGVEEPWPVSLAKKGDSAWIKQQAQIHGAFVGGLLRHGFDRVYEVNNQAWKNPIRDATGIRQLDKWTVKDWGQSKYGIDLPDIVKTAAQGYIERPPDNKSKAYGPNDCYDALGVMNWTAKETGLALSLPF